MLSLNCIHSMHVISVGGNTSEAGEWFTFDRLLAHDPGEVLLPFS